MGIISTMPSESFAQNFYGAPPPADFGQGIGEPVDDNAAALEGGGPQIGKLPFVYNFAVREGYDDNLFTTKTDKSASFYTNIAAGIQYTADNPRLRLVTGLNGGITYYYTRPGNKNDYTGAWTLDSTYQLTPRLILTLSTNTAYLAQPDLTIAGGTNRQNGDYIYSNTTLGAAYQWTDKFSTETKYNFAVSYYVEQSLNDTQGNISQTISQSAKWLILPKTTGVLEYRANPTTYFQADLDSFGNYFLLGVDQVFNPKFRVTTRGGAQVNFNQNQTDGSSVYVGPFGELNLSYEYMKASNISLSMRYGTEASGLNDVTQRQTFRIGFNMVQGITQRLSLNLGINYQNNYYDQPGVIPDFYENIIELIAGGQFNINRFVSLQAGYTFTADIAPVEPSREYTRNVAFVGVNFTF